jgi:hypothetical protein
VLTTVVLIVAASLAFALALTVAIVAIGRAVHRSGLRRLDASGFPALRRSDARSLGITSLGAGQIRGNGVLALGPSELLFLQAIPRRELRVRLEDVRAVETTRRHLGKSVGSELLRVTWISAGAEDSAAWEVRDLAGWLAALDSARGSAAAGEPRSGSGRP